MPRRCTICDHAERAAIDGLLVDGELPNRRIATQFHVTEPSVRRHKAQHVPAALAKAQQAVVLANADDLVGKVAELEASARRICGVAERAGDYRTALTAIRELTRLVELMAKLLGELDERPQVNIVVAPQWILIRSALLNALTPFPEARITVAKALQQLEAQSDNGHHN